jgi:hypothetical protein
MKKRGGFLLLVVLVFVSLGFFVLFKTGRWQQFKKEPAITSGVSSEESSFSQENRTTLYINEEFGFSLRYPANWELPNEKKITPFQQHLYQIVFPPEGYQIDIYDQPSLISLSSFVRDYFPEVTWSQETIVNQQEGFQFVLSQGGTKGIGVIALRKGSFILVISTPEKEASEGNWSLLVQDETLTKLVASFQWLK